MEFMEAIHPEWQHMWAGLADDPLNAGDAICLYGGKCWEYMGSSGDHHHFRHPRHPATDKPEYVYVERRRMVVGWACGS